MVKDAARQLRTIKTAMVLTLSLGLLLAAIISDAIFPFDKDGSFSIQTILLFVILAMALVPGMFRLTALALTRAGLVSIEDLPDPLAMVDPTPVVEAVFETVEALQEAIDTLLKDRQFYLPGATGATELAACTLTLVHPNGQRHDLPGEAVWAREDGVGLQFAALDDQAIESLTGFVTSSVGTAAQNVHARIRALSTAEQQRMAREGTQPERVALERRFGKMVWETLLRNPRISPPEVAKIARNGTIPKPLIEQICKNSAWANNPEIRRALLSNPRCSPEIAMRLLRSLPKNELKMVPNQTAYTMAVRNAARKLLGKMAGM